MRCRVHIFKNGRHLSEIDQVEVHTCHLVATMDNMSIPCSPASNEYHHVIDAEAEGVYIQTLETLY